METRYREAGFTLLEILIVVSIIGILMAVVATNLLGRANEANVQLAAATVTKVEGMLEQYKFDNGQYPSTEQGVEALVRRPSGDPEPRRYPNGGYARRKQIEDPWGTQLAYERPGRVNTFSFDLCSLGSDAKRGGEGDAADICNYEPEDAR